MCRGGLLVRVVRVAAGAAGADARRAARGWSTSCLADGETFILMHPLPLVGVSIGMERGCQQNDSLANG